MLNVDFCSYHSNCFYGILLQRLARWVTKQRKHYKAKQEGKYNALDDEKEQRLHDIGFVFNTKTKAIMRATVMKRFEERWEVNCEKLVAFKNEFGHCAVPRRWKRDLQFASWVMRQVRNSFSFACSPEAGTYQFSY